MTISSSLRLRGPWSLAEAERFLRATCVPLRLAAHGPGPYPLLLSLWYEYRAGELWCATHRSAKLLTRLEADPHCAFEVARETTPYRGVRGRALAELVPTQGKQVLEQLIARYLPDDKSRLASWLLSRAEDEVAIRLRITSLDSWDYSERMGDL